MKTTIESTDRYQVIISKAKELKGIILQSKINNNGVKNSGENN